jgi:hypothetical protein
VEVECAAELYARGLSLREVATIGPSAGSLGSAGELLHAATSRNTGATPRRHLCRAATHVGYELIAAGLLMLAGHTGLDELDKWLHVGWGATPRCVSAHSESEDQWCAPGIDPIKTSALAHDY